MRGAVRALVLSGCLGRGWMTDETDRIDRAMSAPVIPPREDPAFAGVAMGAEAKVADNTPLRPSPGYEIAPPSGRRPTRSGSAPPRAIKGGSGRGSRPKR